MALSDHGIFERAEEQARRSVERHPEHSVLLTNLARVLLASGDREKRQDAAIVLGKAKDTAPVGFRYPQELLAELESQSEPKRANPGSQVLPLPLQEEEEERPG